MTRLRIPAAIVITPWLSVMPIPIDVAQSL
jgi:hypothetical protein